MLFRSVKVIFERLKEEDGIVLKLINMGGGFPANYITRTNTSGELPTTWKSPKLKKYI